MKPRMAALGFALLLQAGARTPPEMGSFRWMRSIEESGGSSGARSGQACAVLDERVYAHAAPALADLRLLTEDGTGSKEVPYALTLSEAGVDEGTAAVLNQRVRGGQVAFDLRMPGRAYSEVRLDLPEVDFVATATVSGLRVSGDPAPVALGRFTLYDLSGQRLGRSTTLRLGESTYPLLHVELAIREAAGTAVRTQALPVTRAEVPPSREAETVYTVVAETREITQRGRESVAEFAVPAHVPVERVSFGLAPGYAGNFSRTVRIRAKAEKASGGETPASEEVTGVIARVRLARGGAMIRESSLGVPAILGSNVQHAAKVEVAVENGDDAPVGIEAVRLEMRQRKLCFDGPGTPVSLYYGADGVKAPRYDYSRVFRPRATVEVARLGPEEPNPGYVARVEVMSFPKRHPGWVWAALVGLVVVLGGAAWGSAKRV